MSHEILSSLEVQHPGLRCLTSEVQAQTLIVGLNLHKPQNTEKKEEERDRGKGKIKREREKKKKKEEKPKGKERKYRNKK